jgi:hypothetical protein
MKKQIEILLAVILCFGWCGLAEAEITVKDWQFFYEQAEKTGDPDKIMIIEHMIENIAIGIAWANVNWGEVNKDLPNLKNIFCPPDFALQRSNYVDFFQRFVKKFPDSVDKPLGLIVLFSLKATFPCNQ